MLSVMINVKLVPVWAEACSQMRDDDRLLLEDTFVKGTQWLDCTEIEGDNGHDRNL